jgi:hypothetical protein
VGTDKPYYSVKNMHTELLPSYAPTANAVSLSWILTKYQHVQFEHKDPGCQLRPIDNYALPSGDTYGAYIGQDAVDAALGLMLNNTVQAKMPALIAYVQGGIDRYYMMLNGHRWGFGEGYGPNMKLPIYFMAALFQDPAIIAAVQALPQPATESAELYRGANGVVLFGDTEYYGDPESVYWNYLATFTGSDNLEYRDPYGLIDGGMPTDSYQFCCLSLPWKGQALAVNLMPALHAIFDYPILLEYADRWVTVGTWTQPDTCAPLTQATHGSNGHGGCIRDNNPSDGTGRYPDKHGANKDDGYYGSGFVASMWTAYRNTMGIQPPAMTEKYVPAEAAFIINHNPLLRTAMEKTAIDFSLSRTQKVTITLYAAAGQVVRVLTNDIMAAGPQQVVWDGKNQAGKKITSGIYYVVLETEVKKEVQRIVVLN